MDTETATSPVEAADTSVEDTGALETEVENETVTEETEAPEAEDDQPETEASEEAEEDPYPEFIEVKVNGKVVKVPAEARDAVLMQEDYTRKTQALAKERESLTAIQQASEAELKTYAQVLAMDQQLAKYAQVDWQTWSNDDPFAAQASFMEYQQLKDQRGQTANHLGQLQQQRATQAQQESAKRLQASAAALADPKTGIKGWSPEYAAKLLETGIREYGFERSEIEEFEDHRMVRVLDDAAKWRAHLAKQKKLESAAKSDKLKPAATLKGTSGRMPIAADTGDFKSFEKLAAAKLKA